MAKYNDPTGQFRELTRQYIEWIELQRSGTGLYRQRIEAAWESLLKDIEAWKEVLDRKDADYDPLVSHHVTQFREFAKKAYPVLVEELSREPEASKLAEGEDFRALVVGVFTAQWLLLRDVVQQRVNGSPYREGLRDLDKEAKEYYATLYHVLEPELKTKTKLASFAPLVHFGNMPQLTVFNRRVPLIIGVPFGALSKCPSYERTRMSIPHEIAHAVFAQVPEVIDEIKQKLKDHFAPEPHEELEDSEEFKEVNSDRMRVLYNLAIQWTEEICADLFGTALAGVKYVESAVWVMASSDSMTGITDEKHPPTLLRPMIHLFALSSSIEIEELEDSEEFKEVNKVRKLLQQFTADKKIPVDIGLGHLNRQFRSVPALMFVRMETISNIMNKLIVHMLQLQLKTLNNKTIAWLLPNIRSLTLDEVQISEELKHESDKWGEHAEITSENFVLDIPTKTVPTFATPGVRTDPFCCVLPIVNQWCSC